MQTRLQRKLGTRDQAKLREQGVVFGAAVEVVDQLGKFAEAGVQRIMLQWLNLDDLEGLTALAEKVLPQVM